MKRTEIIPNLMNILSVLGKNIKLARLRRKITSEQLAERTGICRSTIFKLEKGSPTVAIGKYLKVLYILGLHEDFLKIAADDVHGRNLQDNQLITPKRPKKS